MRQEIPEPLSIKELLDAYLEIQDRLEEIVEEWVTEFEAHGAHIHSIRTYVEGQNIVYQYDTVWDGSCSHEQTHYGKLPLSALWDFDFMENERKRRLEENIKAVMKQAEKKKVQDVMDRAIRYKKYIELKEEFENQDP